MPKTNTTRHHQPNQQCTLAPNHLTNRAKGGSRNENDRRGRSPGMRIAAKPLGEPRRGPRTKSEGDRASSPPTAAVAPAR
ncbi:hypothetical protein RHGRI_015225 [Rhododendron griersonianum]|uniref:Uncharacterized protein n=1 Tax=Rhododendron griersonianum TaxID=479676 RepID=A0AAV6KCG5_9ERIC|nr:hypothetical protein RHGRI_015225 [Rhododendron griersonianum]